MKLSKKSIGTDDIKVFFLGAINISCGSYVFICYFLKQELFVVKEFRFVQRLHIRLNYEYF